MENEISLVGQFTYCHNQLNEIFLLHQEALLQGKLPNALGILNGYASCHELHMHFEDDVFLPKYADLEEQGKWDATLYQQEHQKVTELYLKIERELQWLMEQSLSESQLRRNIIQLLDREKSFKGLCEHHQEREEICLFVELDRQADAHWLAEMRESFALQWEQKSAAELENIGAFL